MIKEQYEKARLAALEMYEKAGIALTDEEKNNLEVADFGLGELEKSGLQIVTYVNNDRYCAKEMVLFPHQTPEYVMPVCDYIEQTFAAVWNRLM